MVIISVLLNICGCFLAHSCLAEKIAVYCSQLLSWPRGTENLKLVCMCLCILLRTRLLSTACTLGIKRGFLHFISCLTALGRIIGPVWFLL